ncbi:MAG: IS30 family transposase [Lentimicrobium sp.]|nr:IS30 family transposase [Lentimicrobium sp.]
MKHLTVEQRYTISAMRSQGFNQTTIALAIEKDKSVVSRELRRNCDLRSGSYDSDLAQRKHLRRQKEKSQHKHFTDDIRQHVDACLAEDFSPEQIAGRAKLEGRSCVSHERIYQYIWQNKKEGGELYQHLRRNGRKYRKRGNAKDTRGIIKDRIGIDQRPPIVDEKIRFGDLEIDTIIGQKHQGAILTINDRRSSRVWIRRLEGKEAGPVVLKTIEALLPIKNLIHTITADNGKEFAFHKEICKALDIDFYFARPYHSWERGANENTNGLIRQYFRKGTSFENVTDEDIEHVQNQLNNRPRKKLSYLTPNEYFFSIFTNPKVALAS